MNNKKTQKLTRRQLLKTGSLISGALCLSGIAGATNIKKDVQMKELAKTDFDKILGERVFFKTSDLNVEMHIIDVCGLKGCDPELCFSVLFKGSSSCVYPQGTYEISHKLLGNHHIFIVPICSEEDGIQYEAIFNRLT